MSEEVFSQLKQCLDTTAMVGVDGFILITLKQDEENGITSTMQAVNLRQSDVAKILARESNLTWNELKEAQPLGHMMPDWLDRLEGWIMETPQWP